MDPVPRRCRPAAWTVCGLALSLLASTAHAQPGCRPRPEVVERLTAAWRPSWPTPRLRDGVPNAARLRCAVTREVASDASLLDTLEDLSMEHTNRRWFPAVERLEQRRAAWSLAAMVWHGHEDVAIRSLRALARLGDRAVVPVLVDAAERLVYFQSGSETATIHGVLQHAVADTLNRLTGAHVQLSDGQDPEGLRAGLARWRSRRP